MRPILFSEQFTSQLITVAKLALRAPLSDPGDRISVVDVLAEVEHQFGGFSAGSAASKQIKDLRYVGETLNEWRFDALSLKEQYRLAEILERVAANVIPNDKPF